MMRFLTPGSAVLAGFCVVLTVLFAYEIASPLARYRVSTTLRPVAITKTTDMKPYVAPPASAFAEIQTRTLFNSNRRPLREPDPVSAPKPPRTPPNMTLVGIILDGKEQIAIARMAGAPVALNLKPGQDVQGWQVKAIRADGLQLQADAQTIDVGLQPPAAGQAQSRAAPPNRIALRPPPSGSEQQSRP